MKVPDSCRSTICRFYLSAWQLCLSFHRQVCHSSWTTRHTGCTGVHWLDRTLCSICTHPSSGPRSSRTHYLGISLAAKCCSSDHTGIRYSDRSFCCISRRLAPFPNHSSICHLSLISLISCCLRGAVLISLFLLVWLSWLPQLSSQPQLSWRPQLAFRLQVSPSFLFPI